MPTVTGETASTDIITCATLELGSGTDTTLSRVSAGVAAIEGVNLLLNGGALGTPLSGALTNCGGLPTSGIAAGALNLGNNLLTCGTLDLGNTTDTTLSRASAGDIQIETNIVYRAGGTDVAVADGGTGASVATTAATNLGLGTASNVQHATLGLGVAPSGALLLSAAGTNSVAPQKFTSGVNLTTAAAGATEFDGVCFYQTAVASARQVVSCEQFLSLTATQTATSGTSAQTWFPGGGATGVTLAGSTSYFFEGQLHLANGTTTHTTSLAFAGAATLTSIKYYFTIASITENAVGVSDVGGAISQAAATILNATSTAAGAHIWIRGIVRVNAGGTFIPQFKWDANPTGTNQVLLNTWFRVWPVGSSSVLNVGNWS